MKVKLTLLATILCVLFLVGCGSSPESADPNAAPAENLLVGGDMEDASAWNVVNLSTDIIAEYSFGYTEAGPAAGKDGCLYVKSGGTMDILFWQAVELEGGQKYTISGAFADLGDSINQFWAEILISEDVPPAEDGTDYEGVTRLAFNTWDGTPSGIDGTFQKDFRKGSGATYRAPGKAGEMVTVYFALDVGAWEGADFEVAIDELSLSKKQ